jgi:nucleoside-diphosphate-sugar epimerase
MGGAGFLGSHLVDALASQGDDVIIADSLLVGSLANIEDTLCGCRATFVYLDLAQPVAQLRAAITRAARFRRIDRMFWGAVNQAALGVDASEVVDRSAATLVIDLAIEQRARVIYASLSDFYRYPPQSRKPESAFGNAAPTRPYLRDEGKNSEDGKRSTEVAIAVAVARHGLYAIIARFINCYGPRMTRADDRLIPALADAISAGMPMQIDGDGLQTRSMMFVDDAIRILIHAASDPRPQAQPFNFASDEERSVLEIAETLARIAGAPFMIEHVGPFSGEPYFRRPDLSRGRLAGFIPRTTLVQGLTKTIAWLRDSAGAYV